MKKIILITSAILLCTNLIHAQNWACPSDVTVNVTDVDPNYSFGTPDVMLNEPFNLSFTLTIQQNECDDQYFRVVSKEWELNYGNTTETCIQTINVEQDDFSDYDAPADTTLPMGDPNNIDPAVTGYYGPPAPQGVIASTYEDTVIPTGSNGFKILRKWTLLNWCTAAILEHNQIITIGDGLSGNFQVLKINGESLSSYEYSIRDENGNEYDLSNCDGTVVDQMNCVAENNPNVSEIELVITKDDDYLNGVSTLDMVLIQRHILGIQAFESVLESMAADASNDQNVSALDLITLRKLILGIDTELANTPAWQFVNASNNPGFPFEDQVFPFSNGDLKFNIQEFPITELTVYGVKKGDVNCSAQ